MTSRNVYFKRPANSTVVGAAAIHSQPALLPPGQFAVVAPRVETVLGQTTALNITMPRYSPSNQSLALLRQAGGGFRLNYQGMSAGILTPRYREDGAGTAPNQTDYQALPILPIIAQSLMPGESDVPERTFPGASVYNTWQGYRDGVDDLEEFRSGFNISEPSPGNTYYLPPQYKPTPDSGPGDWPSVDSFRDYDGAAGLHPDEPFDHNDGAGPVVIESPLQINDWMGLGTYPDAVAVFLQRLADPTRPWHVDDNPYLTVDSAPIDLTVFNGDGDATETIDRDGDGTIMSLPTTKPSSRAGHLIR